MSRSRFLIALFLAFATLPAAAQTADLAITKVAPEATLAYAGENSVYRLTVVNNGPGTATSVTVTDPLPPGLTYQGVDAPGFNCSAPPVGTNGTVSCTEASMSTVASQVLYIFVGIPAATPGGTTFSNTATIASATSDPTPANNSSTATFTTNSGPPPPNDMQMTKTAPTVATQGETITYQLSFGSSATTKSNVTVTDVLPPGITFQSVSVDSPLFNPGYTCTTPAVGANGTVQCFTPLMFNFPFALINVTVKVDPSAPAGTSITNTASVSSTTPDPNPANNTGSATTIVTTSTAADLAITKVAPEAALAYAGENSVYRLTVINNGPATATNVTVTDALPPGLTFQGVDATGFNCSAPPIGTNGTVTCTEASMPASSPTNLFIFVGIPAATPGGTSFSNTATISSATSDFVPGNNSSTATFTTNSGSAPSSDMQMTKTAPATANPGDTITYQLSFGSNTTTKSNVTVTDVLPAGITFQSVSIETPQFYPGFTCTTPAVGANGTVQCTMPLMFNLPFGLIDIVGKVGVSVPVGASITNVASVSSTTPDPNPANNTGSATTAIVAPIPALHPLALALLAILLCAISLIKVAGR